MIIKRADYIQILTKGHPVRIDDPDIFIDELVDLINSYSYAYCAAQTHDEQSSIDVSFENIDVIRISATDSLISFKLLDDVNFLLDYASQLYELLLLVITHANASKCTSQLNKLEVSKPVIDNNIKYDPWMLR